jgi:ankyrin repeat protein
MSGFINSLIKSISKANIFSLIRQGKYEVLIQHLNEYPEDIKLQDENNYTPLTYAYLADIDESGPPETRSNIIQLLVDHGGLNIRNGPIVLTKQHKLNDSTPLTFALITNTVEMAKDLIQRGANVVDKDSVDTDSLDTDSVDTDSLDTDSLDTDSLDTDSLDTDMVITTYNNRKLTPLIAAIIFSPDVVEMLLKLMTLDEINQKIRNAREHISALKLAFLLNKPEMILLLINYGADVTEIDGHTGNTYLHDAINKDFPLYVAEALIKKYPAIVKKVNTERQGDLYSPYSRTYYRRDIPPLTYACIRHNLPLIKLLLQKGADPNKTFSVAKGINDKDQLPNQIEKISSLIDAVIDVDLPITKLLLKYNKKPIDKITITYYGGYYEAGNQLRNSRLFDYFITTVAYNEAHSDEDILNMLFLLLEHGATKNFNLDYNNVPAIINNALIDYPFYLTVEALKANGIEHQLGVDSQRQLAEHMREDQTDRIPQYWYDNQKMIKIIKEKKGDDYYALNKLFDNARFEPQSYFNEKLKEIYEDTQKRKMDTSSASSKRSRNSSGGKMTRRILGGKAKTPHGGKAKTRRYKKA